MFVCLFACLSVCVSVCLAVYLSDGLSVKPCVVTVTQPFLVFTSRIRAPSNNVSAICAIVAYCI